MHAIKTMFCVILVTEEEIDSGLFQSDAPQDQVVCLMRSFTNFDRDHEKAHRFTDVQDEESPKLLSNLKSRIEATLPSSNIHKFNVQWSQNGGMNESEHAGYLESFCEAFECSVKELVDRGVSKRTDTITSSKLYEEVLGHAHICAQQSHRFYGRDDILGRIKNYVTSNEQTPLFAIIGESGEGKTSLLAKVASSVCIYRRE